MRIRFTPNYPKMLECVLWVLNEHKGIHLYNLMKVLFHADYLSVNAYGTPVTSDNYMAMQYGTVPEVIYKGLINKEPLYLEAFQIDEYPLTIENQYAIFPTRVANEHYLSETDKEFLQKGIKEYAFLPFNEVKHKNHSNPGWQKTFDKAENSIIDWYELITDQTIKDELAGISKYLVI